MNDKLAFIVFLNLCRRATWKFGTLNVWVFILPHKPRFIFSYSDKLLPFTQHHFSRLFHVHMTGGNKEWEAKKIIGVSACVSVCACAPEGALLKKNI